MWQDLVGGIPGNAVYDLLKAGGTLTIDRLRKWQNDKRQRPLIQHQLGRDMRLQANLSEINRVSNALLHYYRLGKPRYDARYARYSNQGSHLIDLPLISEKSWINAVNQHFRLRSEYVDPHIIPLPTIPATHHQAARELLKLNFTDGCPYVMRSLDTTSGTITARFSESRFFPWRDSYGDLENEFVMHLPAILHSPRGSAGDHQRYPLRDRLLPDLNTVLNFGQRINAGGVVVLCVFPMERGDARILVEARSGVVSDGHALLTTVPKAFHDSFAEASGDFELETTVMREMVEEIFSGHGLRHGEPETQAYLDSSPPVAELLNREIFRLQLTGISTDLLKGNYTFSFLLLVTDPTWWPRWRREAKLNEESLQGGQTSSFLLSRTSLIESLTKRPDWTAEGYFTFIEGLRALYPLTQARHMDPVLIDHAERARDALPDLTWMQF